MYPQWKNLLLIGTASKPWMNRVNYIFFDARSKKNYLSYLPPPKEYIYKNDTSNEYMLMYDKYRSPTIKAYNPAYERQTKELVQQLIPIKITQNNTIYIDDNELDYDPKI